MIRRHPAQLISEAMEDYEITKTALNPKNFRIWLKEVKGVAKKSKVWDYVDPNGETEGPKDPVFPQISDYQIKKK